MNKEIKENLSEMLFNRDERLLDYITNLEQENERVSNLYSAYEEANELWINKCENYKSRIDKAIEYIKECKIIDKDFQVDYCIDEDIKEDLLNILTGGDEE